MKEICQRAGVNRSTFYLHYETIGDLVNKAAEMVKRRFLSYFPQQEENLLQGMGSRDQEDLILVTQEYLLPHLRFIRDNKKVIGRPFGTPAACRPKRGTRG